MRRQRRNRYHRSELRVRLSQIANEFCQGQFVVDPFAKILTVQQRKFAGDVVVISQPQNRRDDDVIKLQPQLPFLSDIGRTRRLGPTDIDDAVHLATDGVLDLLMERESA